MRRINAPFYALTWEQAQVDYQDGILTTRGLIFAFFSTRLKPGSELVVDVDSLCQQLNIHSATYYRAIGALQACHRLEINKGKMVVAMPESPTLPDVSQTCESDSQDCETNSQDCERQSQGCETDSQDCETEILWKTPGSPPPPDFSQTCECTSNRSTDLQINKQTEGCFVPIDREGIGTVWSGVEAGSVVSQTDALERFSGFIRDSGVRPNKTIQETLAALIEHKGVAAAARLVENALSALEEQRDRGKVRNPGGFLRAALQRGFTSNEAKRKARGKPPARPPEPPNSLKLAQTIDAALWNGDRAYALERLNAEWQAGWHDQVEELVTALRPDWGFQIVDGEVV